MGSSPGTYVPTHLVMSSGTSLVTARGLARTGLAVLAAALVFAPSAAAAAELPGGVSDVVDAVTQDVTSVPDVDDPVGNVTDAVDDASDAAGKVVEEVEPVVADPVRTVRST